MNPIRLCRFSLSPFRVAAPILTAMLLFLLAAAAAGRAQPSGGPYGPIQQRYDLPPAKRIFYVAPDGKSENTGASLERPTTLEAAIARVVTGDAIILRGGIYRTGGLRLNQGITMQPYADERPILKGTRVATDWKAQPNGLWRTSWDKLFPAQPADWWRRERQARQTPLHLFNNDMLFIDGVLLSAVGGEHEMHEKAFYIDYVAGQVYIATNPENRLVEITAHDSALVRTIREVHGKQNDRQGPVIRGITFTQYAYRALEVEGTEPMRHMDPSEFGKEVVGTTFEHLTISFCSRVAGYFRGDKLSIRHCLIADCGTEGIYVIDSADVLLERNIITRTNSAERITGYFASAVKIFNQSYRVTCRENLVIDNPHASGIWYDVGNVDGVFVNNWIERTNDGFFFEISKGAICAGNVFVNCTRGIHILNSSNVQIYQNTLFNSVVLFERTERSAVGDHFGWHPSAGPDVHERDGHVFINNLLTADETFAGPLIHFRQAAGLRDRLKDPQVKEFDGNVYVRRAGATSQPLMAWSPVPNEKGSIEIAATEELRQLHPEFEARAQVLADYWGPLFRSVELGNFELQRAFPGASAGALVPAPVRQLLKSDPHATFPGAYAPR
jgi:parallel beta-helix repeat protein